MPPHDVSSTAFIHALVNDASLRSAFVAYLDGCIARENTLDRLDVQHPVDFQRGMVAAYRSLRNATVKLEPGKGEPNDGTIQ